MIKSARNVLAKGFKFKPWGAVKLAKNLTKAFGAIGIVLSVGMDIWDTIVSKKQFNDNESYYKNFAPSFLEMQQHAEEMQEAVDRIRKQTERLHDYGERLRKHFDIKDAVKDTAI